MNLRRPRAQQHERTINEAFRVLRSNLLVSIGELNNPVVLVTSALQGEGKTTTCVRLAESLARNGKRVVVVDLDLRKPSAHLELGEPNDVGVTDVLRGTVPLTDALTYIQSHDQVPGMYFLAAGGEVPNPTELLGTKRLARMLDGLIAESDIVLVDTAPVLPVADTLVIGRLAAGALMVVQARRTPTPVVERARDALTRNQTRILGVVLNRALADDGSPAYGYGYGNNDDG